MNTKTYKNTYRNPWFKSLNTSREEFYHNDARQVLEYRGVKVFKLFDRGYDFVLNDCCITQRAGITEARREIDKILDGETPVCNEVHKHLTENGFNAISYDQSHAQWQAKTQRDNIRFAMQWMGGDKLYGVKHVKGDAWSATTTPTT